MSFKHKKFEESEIMLALEKKALDKGMINYVNNAVEKINQKKTSLNKYAITENVEENIIKLCNGLRELGFLKLASELEEKFIEYKKA